MGESGMPAGEVSGQIVVENLGADLQHLVEVREGKGGGDLQLSPDYRR